MNPNPSQPDRTRVSGWEVALPFIERIAKWTFLGLAVWVGWHILAPYPHYVPPDFEFGFLRGKRDFFYRSGYWLGFFAHLAGAPLALFSGALQCSRTLRVRWPGLHRLLGRAYAILVLGLAAPGGLIMATHAYGGLSGAICFASIAACAWGCTWIGWRAARIGNFEQHRRWILRSYVLILSAVFLRLINLSLSTIGMDHEFTYQVSAWLSFVAPLGVLEWGLRQRKLRRNRATNGT
ncbi:MAG: DUF2306 domain-containing protein [Planctomycetota bacterium]